MESEGKKVRVGAIAKIAIVAIVALSAPIWLFYLPYKVRVYTAKKHCRAQFGDHHLQYEGIVRTIIGLPEVPRGELVSLEVGGNLDPSTIRKGPYLPLVPTGMADGRYIEYFRDQEGRLIVRFLCRDFGSPIGSFWLLYTDRPTGFKFNVFGWYNKPTEPIAENWWLVGS